MNHTQFKQYAANIGLTFAARMALQEGVCSAQVHLWVIQARPKGYQEVLANLVTK